MIAYLFPGQGSQHVGMGADLFRRYPEQVAAADDILGYSLERLCVEDPDGQLSSTEFTQPALYTVDALSWLRCRDEGKTVPDFLAGHSLGEFAALFAAEVFDFETGLRMVQRRGALMAQARGGGMAAVLGLDETAVREVMKEEALDTIDLANINSPRQCVVAGMADDVERAREVFERHGARYVPLNVSGAFHSRYMEAAWADFADYISGMTFNPPRFSVVANVTARPHVPGEIPETLARQISSPVRWSESMRYLMGRGVTTFTEVGPGSVLTGLQRSIERDAVPLVEEGDSAPGSQPGEPGQDGAASSEPSESLPMVCGSMHRGVSGPELVAAAAAEGVLAVLGTEGLSLQEVEERVVRTAALAGQRDWALAVSHSWRDPDREAALVDVALRHRVRWLEASGYVSVSPSLVRFRLSGATRGKDGVVLPHQILCKTSRPEVARSFCAPAPADMVSRLVGSGRLTETEGRLAVDVATASWLCAESQGGWVTDHAPAMAVLPTFIRLRDEALARGLAHPLPVGLSGGLGAPEAVAAALVMGAEFVMTGSINQCTVEAATSDHVKDMLAACEIQDTTDAPSAVAFELGTRMQVMRRGVLFAARAQRLRDIYERFTSWDEVDERTRDQVERRVLGESFADARARAESAGALEAGEKDGRMVMAAVFRAHLDRCAVLAIEGDPDRQVDYLVPSGPAMGAFNSWVKGTDLEDWRRRQVGRINRDLYEAAAALVAERRA